MPCWWRMQTRQTCHLWAVCTHVHSHLGRDTAASPRGKQQDTAIWSIGILFWMACNSSSIVAGFMGLNFFVWRFLRGRALNRERNGLLIPGWHWKGKCAWALAVGWPGYKHNLLICVCVCVWSYVFCWRFKLQPMEIYVDDEAKLTLHGLVQVRFLWEYLHVYNFSPYDGKGV
jgi:hypothetical protein